MSGGWDGDGGGRVLFNSPLSFDGASTLGQGYTFWGNQRLLLT